MQFGRLGCLLLEEELHFFDDVLKGENLKFMLVI